MNINLTSKRIVPFSLFAKFANKWNVLLIYAKVCVLKYYFIQTKGRMIIFQR